MKQQDRVLERCEIVIVGGGLIGLAIAFELCERGRQVLVLERGDLPGQATWASAGMLAPAAEADVDLPGLPDFRKFSHPLYPEFVRRLEESTGVDCGLSTRGSILVALDRDQRAELDRLRTIMHEQGFDAQEIEVEKALAMEPNLSPRVVRAMFLEHDHNLDPRRLLQALRAAIQKKNGRILDGARVTNLDPRGKIDGQQTLANASRAFHIECDHLVLAAGAWSNVDVAGPTARLPLRPIKGQIVRIHAPGLLRHVVRTPDVYLVPHVSGDLVVGATVEEQGFDVQPTAGGTFDLLRHAWRALPTIYDMPLTELAVGFRPTARDHLPILGRWGTSRLYVATAHYRNGILLAPGTAEIMAQLICEGTEHPLLEHFKPERFGSLDDPERSQPLVQHLQEN